jgi:hypothetical protein
LDLLGAIASVCHGCDGEVDPGKVEIWTGHSFRINREMREAERDCLEPIAAVKQEAVEVALVMKIVRPCS